MDDVRQEFTTIAEEHRVTDNQSDIAERVSEDDCLLMFFFFFLCFVNVKRGCFTI